jgi:hypothetical protein
MKQRRFIALAGSVSQSGHCPRVRIGLAHVGGMRTLAKD